MMSDEDDWNQVKKELESAVKLARRGATVSGVLEQAEDALLATQKAVRQSAEATAAAAAVAKGELEQAVQLYKQVIKLQPHGEAYATLSKVLADQGKYDLSDKAMLKATKLHNEQLASWSLF